MASIAQITLSFDGAEARHHELDFYDVTQAMLGFQRSLAITSHLILNGKIITQAPALKGATIRATPPRAGSWEIMALISLTATGVYKLGTTPKGTPIGHLVYSAYDYVLKSVLGINVNYEKSIGAQLEERKKLGISLPEIGPGHLDALAEKCEVAITEMHRPIVQNETATFARIVASEGNTQFEIGHRLDAQTFEHLAYTIRSKEVHILRGRVAGYYSASYKGRMFLPEYGRTLPFELLDTARDKRTLRLVTESLSFNTLDPGNNRVGFLTIRAHFLTSRNGTLKRLHIVSVISA